jgi:negative regulator of genetic competence, sporulation and motility
MYVVFIYNDYENKLLNSICFFSKIKDILIWSKGLIKYNDVSKTSRVYKTYKCFFKVIEVPKKDEHKYFKKHKKYNKHSQLNIYASK